MSVTLILNNFGSGNTKEISSFGADVAIGATSLTLKNNQNITANDCLLLGTPGAERGELTIVQSVAGSTLATTSAILFAHQINSKITALNGSQLRVYRAANTNNMQPTDGNFALFTNSTVAIDPDQLQTLFTDATGSSAYWYKYTFYNPTTLAETDLAASACMRGGTISYTTLDAIRQESGIRSRFITDGMVDSNRKAAEAQVNSAASGRYTLPFTTPINAGIEYITRVLAAGYLMTSQYDQFTDLYNNGKSKVDWAMAQLAELKSGQLVLVGADGNSSAAPNTLGFSGYPTATTADDTDGAEDFMFTRADIDGYNARVY